MLSSKALHHWTGPPQLTPAAVFREVIEMADNALKAKQRAAEKLARQLDVLRQRGVNDKLLKRVRS